MTLTATQIKEVPYLITIRIDGWVWEGYSEEMPSGQFFKWYPATNRLYGKYIYADCSSEYRPVSAITRIVKLEKPEDANKVKQMF